MAIVYIYLMVGLLGVVLGFVIMKYKLGYLVSFINIKKYDNDKVANIAGSHIMVYGFVVIFLAGISYVTMGSNVENIIVATMIITGVAIEIAIYSRINKYAKLEKI
ncbi:hypothetical protein CHL78_008485 [Romboutsia weinsteinii]|uniref:DUF3784 domain-containing protein n=1 Tax=Romboutsia weinsteinii TaxID=2020949 RepID=A0A255IKM5_9FIRM|nr:hypothetical protein [Romboutsia weinsteinii]RDY27747.1 hypothetical protein CHL78_008485 [Romboutsia weinsteinii]